MIKTSIRNLIIAKITGEWGDEATDREGVKVIRTANFTNTGIINFDNLVYRKIDKDKIEQKKLRKGDIIIEKSGGSPSQPVGRVVFFDLDTEEKYLCNNFTTILRPNTKKVYPKFLFYRLFIGHIRKETLKYQNKTTGIINLMLDNYLNETVELPPISDQIKIVTVLSKIEGLIKQRKEGILLLENYLRSIFFKMFGDPIVNEKKWDKVALVDICEKIGSGSTPRGGKENYIEKGISLIRSLNVHNNKFRYKDLAFITDKQAFDLRNVIVQKNDILLNITGASVARSCMVPNDVLPARVNQHVAIIRPNENVVNPFYLNRVLTNTNFQNYLIITSKSKGATREAITKEDIELFNIPVPPINMQKQFASNVGKVEKLKEYFQNSSTELENLYNSLSQKAFNGELDLSRLQIDHILPISESSENDFSNLQAIPKNTNRRIKERQEKEQVNIENVQKFYGGGEPTVSWEWLASQISKRFENKHFNFEMLLQFIKREKLEDIVRYYSSEEMKANPKLNETEDIKTFIQTAVVNVVMDERQKRTVNPFIKLEQKFYNAKNENFKLVLDKEDAKLIKNRTVEERSGIYFKIVK